MNLYQRISDLCDQNEISIAGMCKKGNISPSIIYDLKSGKKTGISRKTAEKIAAVLGIDIEQLYTEEPDEVDEIRDEFFEQRRLLFDLSSKVKPEDLATVLRIVKGFIDE